jgi:hypothetical protein
MLASCTALGCATVATEMGDALAAISPDADLVGLVGDLIALGDRSRDANAVSAELLREFYEQHPEPPVELKWRPGDPVGYSIVHIHGQRKCLCDRADIARVRSEPPTRREFVGTDDQWEENGCTTEPKNDSFKHLFVEVPDERLQARMDEIVAARECYDAAIEKLKSELVWTLRMRAQKSCLRKSGTWRNVLWQRRPRQWREFAQRLP